MLLKSLYRGARVELTISTRVEYITYWLIDDNSYLMSRASPLPYTSSIFAPSRAQTVLDKTLMRLQRHARTCADALCRHERKF